MAEINLRDFYPWHHQNQYIEISEELIEPFRQWEREEHAYLQKRRRYRAVYSLDRGDGIEVKAAVSVISPDEECERKETCERLFQALFPYRLRNAGGSSCIVSWTCPNLKWPVWRAFLPKR